MLNKSFYLLAFSIFLISIASISFLNEYAYHRFFRNLKQNDGRSIFWNKTPDRYEKSDHVSFFLEESDEVYSIKYSYFGPSNNQLIWESHWSKQITDKAILKYGISKSFFDPYYPSPQVDRQRKQELNEALWKEHKGMVQPDLSSISNYYSPYTKSIAQFISEQLESSSKRELIDHVLRFCQDIPYGVPPNMMGNTHLGGVFVPPQLLVNGYGDCDSKSTLFMSILSHFKDIEGVFLHTPSHVLIGIKGIPGPYDDSFVFKNEKYVLCEPVGVARLPYGKAGKEYRIVEVEAHESNHEATIKNQIVEDTSGANNGKLMLWSSISEGGNLKIFIDDESVGEIGVYFESEPDCGNEYALNLEFEEGIYRLRAENDAGDLWKTNVTIKRGVCNSLEFN
ncbi:hypothetical protein [Sediminitomix flava]|uniref:Transglutaminase superfamily protein n=1 Tax=Sediminitomix flava TaxID=379075 RepID=A0A315Z910_SEDFL|nr:hypothetical protein [Sediminitomix flava]PWJ40190.1 hypothetical protein BC781_105258 [Sediminitomix flava]